MILDQKLLELWQHSKDYANNVQQQEGFNKMQYELKKQVYKWVGECNNGVIHYGYHSTFFKLSGALPIFFMKIVQLSRHYLDHFKDW